MGFKSKEIIIRATMVLNEHPKYLDKIILATIGHEPCYGTINLVGTFFSQRFFIGNPTSFAIPMHHYAVAEKKN